MESSFNIVDIILLLGTTQGIFLALLLFNKPINKQPNRLLALLVISYSAFIVESSISGTRIAETFPHILGLAAGVVFLDGPLHFLYARSLLSPDIGLSKKDLCHFALFFVFYIYFLFPFYIQSGAYKIAFIQSAEQYGSAPALVFFSWAVLIQGLLYMIATFRLLQKHSENIKENFSSIERINLGWLKNITLMTMVTWTLGILIECLQIFGMDASVEAAVPLAIAVLIYAMGYMGLRQPEIFSGAGEQAETKDLKKYERSGLTKDKAHALHDKLVHLMETRKPYADPNLKLRHLAHLIATTPNYLSQVINEERQQNFYDFVNRYRIDAARGLITDPANREETLLSIAYSVGFNSKSAFNTAFKKNTGMTPSQFKKSSAA